MKAATPKCHACGQNLVPEQAVGSVEGQFHPDCYEDRSIDAAAEQLKAEARARRDSAKKGAKA